MKGKLVRNPLVYASAEIDQAIERFAKHSKQPHQKILIQWLLSRTQMFLGSDSELLFGGRDFTIVDGDDEEKMKTLISSMERNGLNNTRFTDNSRPESVRSGSVTLPKAVNLDGTYTATKELKKALLGKSLTLDSLDKVKPKGRPDARATVDKFGWTTDHLRLCGEIEDARDSIANRLDERRRMMEIKHVREVS